MQKYKVTCKSTGHESAILKIQKKKFYTNYIIYIQYFILPETLIKSQLELITILVSPVKSFLNH